MFELTILPHNISLCLDWLYYHTIYPCVWTDYITTQYVYVFELTILPHNISLCLNWLYYHTIYPCVWTDYITTPPLRYIRDARTGSVHVLVSDGLQKRSTVHPAGLHSNSYSTQLPSSSHSGPLVLTFYSSHRLVTMGHWFLPSMAVIG